MKCLTLLLLLNFVSYSQTKIKVGDVAPSITITDWVKNEPADKVLKNRNIVLEFWATWCMPCLSSVPHLNNLQQKFQNDVVFVSVTNENVSKIKHVLKLVDFKSVVVSDQTNQTQLNYGDGVKGIPELPLTVLIDKNNRIKWIGTPKKLDEKILNAFLKDQIITQESKPVFLIPPKKNQQSGFEKILRLAQDNDVEFYFELRKSVLKLIGDADKSAGKSLFYLEAVNLKDILIRVLDYNPNQLLIEDDLLKERYDVLYKNGNPNNESSEIFERNVLNVLNIKKSEERKELLSNELSVNNRITAEISTSIKPSELNIKNKLILTSYTISMLVEELNKNSNQLFFYEGMDNSRYDFMIDIDSDASIVKDLSGYSIDVKEGKHIYPVYKFEKD